MNIDINWEDEYFSLTSEEIIDPYKVKENIFPNWNEQENNWHVKMMQIGLDLAHYSKQFYIRTGTKLTQEQIENWKDMDSGAIKDVAKLLHDWTESRINTLKIQFNLQSINAELNAIQWKYLWAVELPNQICTLQRNTDLNQFYELNSFLTWIDKFRIKDSKDLTNKVNDLKLQQKAIEHEWRTALDLENELTSLIMYEFRT